VEWPVEAVTLRGATLTSRDYSSLKWVFNADGTHTLSNGDQPLPAAFGDKIKNDTYLKAKSVCGRWSIKDMAGNRRQMAVHLETADGKRPPTGGTFWVFPYHSSAQYVHFCASSIGHGGVNLVFKLTPAEGQPLPTPPK
jgi:hypothetical protein